VQFYASGQYTIRVKEPKIDIVINKIKQGELQHYNLLAIDIGRKESNKKAPLISALNLEPIKVFENNRGDSILIFQQ